jgi:hypothetical protein
VLDRPREPRTLGRCNREGCQNTVRARNPSFGTLHGYLARFRLGFWRASEVRQAEHMNAGRRWPALPTGVGPGRFWPQRSHLPYIANRRAWEDRAIVELRRATRSGEPLCVAMVDLDDLKTVNDDFGHAAGDLSPLTATRQASA